MRISIEKGRSWADEMLGDLAAAEVHASAAAELAEEIGDPLLLAQSLGDLGFIELLRGRSTFRATMKRALAHEPRRGVRDPAAARWIDVRTRWFGAVVLAWTDELDGSRAALLALRAETEVFGHEQVLPNILNWLGRVDCFAGNWRAGLASARGAYDAAVQAGLSVERPYTLATIALAHAHLGEVEAARDALAEGLLAARQLEVVPGTFELLAAQGFLELSLARPQEAHATLADLAQRAATAGFVQPATQRFQPDLIEASLAIGDLDCARRVQGELEQSAVLLKSPWAQTMAARCAGMITAAEGNLEEALVHLEHALREHQRLPDPFERGRTLLQHGIVLRRLKRKRAARASIASALSTFDETDSPLWAERARSELARISGGNPRVSSSLTETEARVAVLVAAGRANKEVAAELHVTVRTVESNLTRIYRKLGVRSRGQLAAKLPTIH